MDGVGELVAEDDRPGPLAEGGHGVEGRPEGKSLVLHPNRIQMPDDRRQEVESGYQVGDHVLDVMVDRVEGAGDQGYPHDHQDLKEHEHRKEERLPAQPHGPNRVAGQDQGDDDEQEQQHDHRHHVVEQAASDDRPGDDLSGELDTLHELARPQEGGAACGDARGEEGPGEQPAEELDGVVGVGLLPNDLHDHCHQDDLIQGRDERPEQPQERSPIAGFDLPLDHRPEELARAPGFTENTKHQEPVQG